MEKKSNGNHCPVVGGDDGIQFNRTFYWLLGIMAVQKKFVYKIGRDFRGREKKGDFSWKTEKNY